MAAQCGGRWLDRGGVAGVLLSVLVALGLRLLPKTPAAVRFAVWFGVFVVVAALPLAGLLQHGGGCSEWRDVRPG